MCVCVTAEGSSEDMCYMKVCPFMIFLYLVST